MENKHTEVCRDVIAFSVFTQKIITELIKVSQFILRAHIKKQAVDQQMKKIINCSSNMCVYMHLFLIICMNKYKQNYVNMPTKACLCVSGYIAHE